MKKALLPLIIASLTIPTIPVLADFNPEVDEVIIYDNLPDPYEHPAMDETFSLMSDESEMEVVTISTANELIAFRDMVNSDTDYSKNKIFKLMNSIDLGGIEWEPIGYNNDFATGDSLEMLADYSFWGIFDGQGNTISNFKMTDNTNSYMGFFGAIYLGTVRNLNINDAEIDYTGKTSSQIPEFSGLLCAFSNYATISNCNVNGNISITNTSAYRSGLTVCTGMLSGVGLVNADNCNVSGNISVNTLTPPNVGGILGFATTAQTPFDVVITDCTSAVSFDVESISGMAVGGIVGNASNSIDEISDCSYGMTSDSSINTSHTYTTESPSNTSFFVGGIAGINNTSVKHCSVGDIVISADAQSSPTVGGVVGRNEGSIDTCSTMADISIELNRSSVHSAASATAGGISGTNGVGHNTSANPLPAGLIPIIKNCTVTPDVSIKIVSESASASSCGFISGTAFAPAEIEGCVSLSSNMEVNSKNAATYAGGICGFLNGASVKYCAASGELGKGISSATTTYIGGIAGDANLKYFYTYDTSFGITSPLFTVAKFYGAVIENFTSEVDITASDASNIYAGGIVGFLTNNYSEDGTNYYIHATRELLMSECAAKGNVTVEHKNMSFVGGAIGYSIDGKINNSYSTGTVTVTNAAKSLYIGGFIGAIYQNKHDYVLPVATIDNCYTTSTLTVSGNTSSAKTGAFLAHRVVSPITGTYPQLRACYYPEGSEQLKFEGLEPLSADALRSADSYTGWNFDEIWRESENGPMLKHEFTDIADYTTNDGVITSLLISKPSGNSKIYVVSYINSEIDNVSICEIGDDANGYFITLSCNIPHSEDLRFYIWGGKDCMQPLTDVISI